MMKYSRERLLFVLALATAGCGDGDKVLTGAFIDSAVTGLRYATPSRSGLTNEDGEFAYLAGETVTFSLGGITLGRAQGASILSPYDLVGIMPVTDEAMLRANFGDPSRVVVSDLDRVTNIALLLLALDSDGLPENGLDLTGWDATLAFASLDLDQLYYDFWSTALPRFARAHGLVLRSAYQLDPLAHLHASLGVATPTHLKTKYESDSNDDGITDLSYSYAHDSRGFVTGYEQDQNGDGASELRQTSTFGDLGQTLSVVTETDQNGDGIFETRSVNNYTYDNDGAMVGEVDESSSDDVLDARITRTITRTAGSVTTIDQSDTNGDGLIDSRARHVDTFDADGDLVTQLDESDSNANNVADYRLTTTNQYDASGLVAVTTEIYDFDGDADGNTTPDRVTTTTFTRNAAGKVTSIVSERHNAANALTERDVIVSTFDAAGHRLSTTEEDDTNGNGTADSKRTSTSTYDAAGKPTLDVLDNDVNNDGIVDVRVTTTYAYDAVGNPATTNTETDSNADGVVDERRRITYTYDAFGNQLGAVFEADFDGDGVYENVRRETNAYSSIADGLLALFTYYYGL